MLPRQQQQPGTRRRTREILRQQQHHHSAPAIVSGEHRPNTFEYRAPAPTGPHHQATITGTPTSRAKFPFRPSATFTQPDTWKQSPRPCVQERSYNALGHHSLSHHTLSHHTLSHAYLPHNSSLYSFWSSNPLFYYSLWRKLLYKLWSKWNDLWYKLWGRWNNLWYKLWNK